MFVREGVGVAIRCVVIDHLVLLLKDNLLLWVLSFASSFSVAKGNGMIAL